MGGARSRRVFDGDVGAGAVRRAVVSGFLVQVHLGQEKEFADLTLVAAEVLNSRPKLVPKWTAFAQC